MSVYDMRTVITPRVMPPKPEAKPLAPVRTLEQDAALSRARAKQRDGVVNMQAAQVSKHHGRMRANGYAVTQEERRQACLEQMPARSIEIARALGISEGYVKDLLSSLSHDGLTRFRRQGSFAIWERTTRQEAAE